jgi:glutathione S-transferase
MRRGSAELIAGGGEHGIDGVAAWVCEVIATHAVMFLEMAELNSNKVLQIYKCFAEGSTSNLASCSIDSVENPMITLYSYPELFGVADNNGYGLKVFAFLRLNGMPFKHEHVFDASAAPRGQLPYIVDDGETIGDSDTIIAHVIAKNRLKIDAALTAGQRDMSLLITRMLDDLYWVMSYSRWKDERFWPAFRDALLREHPSLTEAGLRKAQEFNFQRYHFQGIGRYAPDAAYARGLADLKVLADIIPANGYVHGETPTSIDAGIYGFIANIFFYDIDTPLKQFVVSAGNMVRHCRVIHDVVMARPRST